MPPIERTAFDRIRGFEWIDLLTPKQRRKQNFREFVKAASKRK